MPRMRRHHVRAVAAVLVDAQAARGGRAHVVFLGEARRTRAAAQPGKHDAPVADLNPLGVGAEFDHTADDFMPHGQRQSHAAIRQGHLLAAADIVVPLPDVQVGVADAAMGDLEQHLGAFRLGCGEFDFLQRLPIFDDGPGAHGGCLRSFIQGGWLAPGGAGSSL